jgi:hypothetical protein
VHTQQTLASTTTCFQISSDRPRTDDCKPFSLVGGPTSSELRNIGPRSENTIFMPSLYNNTLPVKAQTLSGVIRIKQYDIIYNILYYVIFIYRSIIVYISTLGHILHVFSTSSKFFVTRYS